jgi:hypothetical protein
MLKETAWKWIEDNKDQLAKISDDIWGFASMGSSRRRAAS